MFNFLEFFAGAGMARIGLGNQWRCVFANDLDSKKADAYVANFGDEHLHVGDVGEVRSEQLPVATLSWASFPCQDLSLAGNGKGLMGERSGVFWKYWNLMESICTLGQGPSIIVLENVCGTISANGGNDFSAIADAFVNLGYRFGAVVLDAVHFLPQSRPRLFFIGVSPSAAVQSEITRNDPNALWHPRNLVETKFKLSQAAQDKWIWWDMPAPRSRTTTFSDIIESAPQSVEWNSKEQTRALLDMMTTVNRAKVQSAMSMRSRKVGTLYKRTRKGVCRAEVRFDDIAGCLRTPSGGSSRQTIMVIEKNTVRTRLVSSRETARLMGLPDNYVLPDNYNDAYRLTGDGVVVPVVSHLADNILTPIAQATRQREQRAVAC